MLLSELSSNSLVDPVIYVLEKNMINFNATPRKMASLQI
jgi:hypothetical protein